MFGGTNINKDVSALNRGPPNILVGTPSLPALALSHHSAILAMQGWSHLAVLG